MLLWRRETLRAFFVHFGLDVFVVRHRAHIGHVDRKRIKRVVALDIGQKFVLGAAANRNNCIQIRECLFVWREKVSRTKGVRVAAEPLRAISRAEKWGRLNERDIPATEQLELMRRGTSRKATTDDQRSFHLEFRLTELIEKGFVWCHFVGNQALKKVSQRFGRAVCTRIYDVLMSRTTPHQFCEVCAEWSSQNRRDDFGGTFFCSQSYFCFFRCCYF